NTAVSCCAGSPITKPISAGIEIEFGIIGVTVTTHVPTLPLASFAVAVIFAVPSARAVTTPELSTVATAVLLDAHSYVGSVAVAGITVAVKGFEISSITNERVAGNTEIFVTKRGETVTTH